MRDLAADRFITIQTEYQLGIYDGNEEAMLASVRRLLEQFPDDSGYQLSEVSLLGSLGHYRQRIERLHELVAKPQPHPLLMLQLGIATGQATEVIEWQRNRFEKYASKNKQPTITYVDGLLRYRRYQEALEAMETALQKRPDDGELKLYVAYTLSNLSSQHWEAADALLQEAKGAAPERGWRQTAAHLCLLKGELSEAKEHLERLLPLTPMAIGLHEEISDIVGQLEGPDAAIQYWRKAAENFPHYIPLQERYAMALRGRPLEFIQPVLEGIIDANPDNSWAVRELAHSLLQAGKLAEAEKLVVRADELDHEHPFMANLKAMLAFRLGKVDEAKQILRQSLENNINDEYSFSTLMNTCDAVDESRAELDCVYKLLCEHAVTGGIIPPDELLALLKSAQLARTDLWSAHQAVIRQLTQMQSYDEAQIEADKAIEQFPLEPACWYERYQVALATGDLGTQLDVLEHLLVLRPDNGMVLRALADLRVNLGQSDQAYAALQELVAQQPLDAVNRGYLGDCLLELKDYTGAFDQFETAVRLEPDYSFGWGMLERVSDFLDRSEVPENLARELTNQRPYYTVPWLNLARYLATKRQYDEAMECLEKAESIDPYNVNVHARRSEVLVSSGDYEAALKALSPPVFAQVPARLKLQRAHLLWDLGNHQEAYSVAHQTAADEPVFLEAWQAIEQWAVLLGETETAKNAIDKQIELSPSNPDILDAAGNRFIELQDKERAIAAFRRAIEIAPSYTGSRCQLFDLLFELEEIDEAEEVVRNIPRLDDHPVVIARRMMVADKRQDSETVEACWEAMLKITPAHSWAVAKAIEILTKNRAPPTLVEPIRETMEAAAAELDQLAEGDESTLTKDLQTTLDVSGYQLMSLQLPDVCPLAKDQFNSLIGQAVGLFSSGSKGKRKAGESAFATLLRWFGAQENLTQLNSVLQQHRDLLQGNTHLWTVVAFLMADAPTRFSKWQMSDWLGALSGRDDMLPWMYTNIHELLRLVGRES